MSEVCIQSRSALTVLLGVSRLYTKQGYFNCSIGSQNVVCKAGVLYLFYGESEVGIQSRCDVTVLMEVRSLYTKQACFNCSIGSQKFENKAGVL